MHDDVPDPRPHSRLTPRVRRDALVDAAALRLVSSRVARPDAAMLERIGGEVGEALALFDERGLDRRPDELPPGPARSHAACARSRAGRATSGSPACRGSTGTSRGPRSPGAARFLDYRVNRVARAALLEHRGGDRPWLVCLHGFGMGRPGLDLRAFRALHLHRELGLNLAFLTLPFHGRRNPGSMLAPPMPSADVLDTIHGLTQAVWDVRQLFVHIRTKTDLPIGLMGLSLGGLVSALVASIDEPHAVALLVPAVDLPSLMADASFRGEIGPELDADLLERARPPVRARLTPAPHAQGARRTAAHRGGNPRPLRPPDRPGGRALAPLGRAGPALVPRRTRVAVLGSRGAGRDRRAPPVRRPRRGVAAGDVACTPQADARRPPWRVGTAAKRA